ncbi:tyrosine-sulfated glycopeptide receptor 1 [Argentina anserina]|uniref:tyrosine-sulfated glycopeptide receptor 1 n=1 Tax=Argentina anserina TaxID=57926 RepID=UPI0021766304|nr:tyrosine-sulfated glycopeptide receptor 1 [Potentilla anserina]
MTDSSATGQVLFISSSLVPMKHDKKPEEVPTHPKLPLLFFSPNWASLVLLFLLLLLPCSVSALCHKVDQDALLSLGLSFKVSSPLNWSVSSDCCLWEGVLCGEDDRVVNLSLPGRGIRGPISPAINNLNYLTHLDLSYNSLLGVLPDGFFQSLFRLQALNLSFNRLNGYLPLSSNASKLQIVDLSSNYFNGTIPSSILIPSVAAGPFVVFNVSNNSFTGSIPISVLCKNGSSLTILDFSFNKFNGTVSTGLGPCSKLQVFSAGFNALSGPLPDDIYDLADLQQLSLPANHLTGPIDDRIVRLTNVKILELYSNQFIGPIPSQIGKLFRLEKLVLHINNLTGALPPSLSNCTNLSTLNLRVNSMSGELSAFNFSTLQRLSILDLGNNNFAGQLPQSLYSCKSLAAVRFASNRLTGQISPDIAGLKSLSFLSISNNNLTNATGAFRILRSCKNLTTLVLSRGGFMNEPLPDDESLKGSDGFERIQILALGGCNFTGQVPTWLGKLKKLEVLDLSFNHLTGPIPAWFGSLPNLFYMDLSNNLLTGGFPRELCGMPGLTSKEATSLANSSYLELPVFVMPQNVSYLQYNQLSNLPPAIYLGNNSLSGIIPTQIGQLEFILVLDLSHNNFSGSIPDQICNLTNLERLDLSYNHLSGEIPAGLKGLHFLSFFNVAYNDLQGPVPTGGQFNTFTNSSFEGNPGLCGPMTEQHSCSQSTAPQSSTPVHGRKSNRVLLIGLASSICFGIVFIIAMLAVWMLSKRRIIPGGDSDKMELDTYSSYSTSVVTPELEKDTSLVIVFPTNTNEIKDLTIYEILKATNNFNQANIIGCGGFGLVYKATLANGTKLAVKKLSGDLGLMEREFKAEVEALSTAQHDNLVSLQGYCVHDGVRLLMYSYMENGSLDYWLHEKPDGASRLDWPTRLKIARGAGDGLAYMHQICEPHIVHRDIKSSNILLDEKFKAHVADFGLSRLILPYETHVTTELVGTLGYIPPEYGQAWVATLRGDIYSFGVVMLELLTGKRPFEVCKPRASRDLVSWVEQMRKEGKPEEVFDPLLRGKGFEEEMLQVLDVACMCVNQNPVKRPTINEVVHWLENVGASHQDLNKD